MYYYLLLLLLIYYYYYYYYFKLTLEASVIFRYISSDDVITVNPYTCTVCSYTYPTPSTSETKHSIK